MKLPYELVQSCTELVHKLRLATSSAHVLTYEWEAFSLKKGGDLGMTPENFADLSKSSGIMQLYAKQGQLCVGSTKLIMENNEQPINDGEVGPIGDNNNKTGNMPA